MGKLIQQCRPKFAKKLKGPRLRKSGRDLPEAARYDAVKAIAVRATGTSFAPIDAPAGMVQYGYGVRTSHVPDAVYHPEEAAAAGAEVDRERGFVGTHGESCGWDEQIAGEALGLRYEIHGPGGRE